MAIRDTWHRSLVYFGLAEDDDMYHDDHHEMEPAADFDERPRERQNVRRLVSTAL